MRYLIPALSLLLLCSCQKNTTDPTPPGGGNGGGGGGTGGTVTLGVQKGIFSSIYHSFRGVLDANDNRIIFTAHNNTNTYDEFYAGDDKDSVYLLTPYGNPNSFTASTAKICLKPNGDIACILKKANATGPDSIIALVNKPKTKNWVLVKKELQNSFWNTYYNNFDLSIFATATGRLVLTGFGNTKAAVSDDDGLTWRQTFTLPASYVNTTQQRSSYSGARSFIISGNRLLYSDDNFENASMITISASGDIMNKIIRLDDQRLVLQYSIPGRTFYQSTNNGQTWSVMPLYDPADTLSVFSNSYFCFVSGNKIRTRAKYQRCNSYYTVDINPVSKFAFYPLTPVPNCPLSTSNDDYISSCQRGDKRMYYAMSFFNGSSTFFIVNRDY